MSDVRLDPFRAFNFRLEIDGIAVAAFSEAGGLTSTGEAVDYRTGVDLPLTVRKLIGLRSFGPITLKRGMVADGTLWEWYRNIVQGSPDRRNGSVVLQDEQHSDVLRWNFENAWPNKIEGPALNAAGNEIALESVELIVEDITLEVA